MYRLKINGVLTGDIFRFYEEANAEYYRLKESNYSLLVEIVKIKKYKDKPMSPEEAILQMNLLDHQFYVFLNSANEKICVVYARKDGGYGLIIPDTD